MRSKTEVHFSEKTAKHMCDSIVSITYCGDGDTTRFLFGCFIDLIKSDGGRIPLIGKDLNPIR